MNWVLIIVLLTLLISVIEGYRKGFLRIVYSLISWVIVLIFVSWFTPYINQFLVNHTSVYEIIEKSCGESIRQAADERMEGEAEGTKGDLSELGISIPDSVMEEILAKTTGAADTFLEESGLYTEIAKGIAEFVVQGIAFVMALVFAWLVVHILSRILGIVSHIPILKGVNQCMGIFAGTLKGLLMIWIVFYLIALCSTGEMGRALVFYIYESKFLTYLYENNLVLTIILNLF